MLTSDVNVIKDCCTDVELLKMIYCFYSNKHPRGAAIDILEAKCG